MALTALDYSVVLTYEVKGIECKNVFWYKSEVTTTASVVAAQFDSEVLLPILSILSSDANMISTYCYNLVTLSDFDTNTHTTLNGDRTGLSMPVFVGWYFQYVRTTRETSHGRKTFAGIDETDVSDGEATLTIAPTLAAVATALASPFIIGAFAACDPCIAKTEEYTNPDNGKIYRRPVELFPINSVVYRRVSTQNSRKR